MKNIYIVRKESTKNKGVFYNNLYIDLGYQQLSLTMDVGIMANLVGVTHEYIMTLEVDKPVLVGQFERVKKEGK